PVFSAHDVSVDHGVVVALKPAIHVPIRKALAEFRRAHQSSGRGGDADQSSGACRMSDARIDVAPVHAYFREVTRSVLQSDRSRRKSVSPMPQAVAETAHFDQTAPA